MQKASWLIGIATALTVTVWRQSTLSAAVALPPVRKRPVDVVSVPVLTGWSHGAGRYQSRRVLCAARREGSFDVWKLAKDARKLALYACGRGRADGLGGRREGLIGSTTSLRAMSE